MARTFVNISTGVMVTPSNERVAAMYADHPSWEEVKKAKKAAKGSTAPDPAAASAPDPAAASAPDPAAASAPDPSKAPDPGTGSDPKSKEE